MIVDHMPCLVQAHNLMLSWLRNIGCIRDACLRVIKDPHIALLVLVIDVFEELIGSQFYQKLSCYLTSSI